jgi:hypothetical protein
MYNHEYKPTFKLPLYMLIYVDGRGNTVVSVNSILGWEETMLVGWGIT